MPQFRTMLTLAGRAIETAANVSGIPINLVQMSLGDGNGNATSPGEEQTTLVRELYRENVNVLFQDPEDPTRFIAELIVPASVGGFTIREAGLHTDDGTLFAIANMPATYKPVASEGAFSDTIVRMIFVIANASVVTLIIDPNVAVATRSWVVNNVSTALMIPGGTTNQVLTKNSNADGDTEWRSPGTALVNVDCIQEYQTAAAGQDEFILVNMSTTGVAVYVNGIREYNTIALDNVRVKLARELEEDDQVMFVQNDPAAPYHNRLQRPGIYFMCQISGRN